jgi:MFS family permease
MGGIRNGSGILTRLAVMFIFLINVEVSLVNVALGSIKQAFPDADPVLISLISTLPILVMFFMTLLVGKLSMRFDKKNLVIVSLIIYIIGGVGGVFMTGSVYQILAMRLLVGIGAGLSAPLCGAIIAELYSESERVKMLGWAQGFDSLMAVLLTMLGGALCVISWNYTFLTYGVFIIILFLVIFCLPAMPPLSSPDKDRSLSEKKNFTPHQKLKIFLVGAYTFSCIVILMLMFIKLAIFVMEENIGSPVTTATAMSACTAASFITAILIGPITKALKRYTLVVCTGLSAVAFLMLFYAQSASVVILALFVNGLGRGLYTPMVQFKAIEVVPKAVSAYAVSVVMGAIFLGNFLSAFIEKGVALFGNPSPRNLFLLGFVMFVLYTLAYLAWIFTHPQKQV